MIKQGLTQLKTETKYKNQKLRQLANWLNLRGKVIVAFSGGVDSSLLLKVATDALGAESAIGITSHSESMSEEALRIAKTVANDNGFNHEIIDYSELEIDNYASNPTNRCFFCKNELYTRLVVIAKARGIETVVEGSNFDDLNDHRPGMIAARDNGVQSPLKELEITKAEIREWAQELGLPNWDLPSNPCLSSRVPYGQYITQEKLKQVQAGEQFLRELGFREQRLRHHGDTAKLEMPTADMQRLLTENDLREKIIKHIKSLGFTYVTLDLQGFRSGSLNEVLKKQD